MDIYQEVTDRIIQSLEAGAPAWLKPWTDNEANDLPHNAATGRHYSGVNVLLLWSESMARGFAGNGWMTYKQAQALIKVWSNPLAFIKRKDGEPNTLRSAVIFIANRDGGQYAATFERPSGYVGPVSLWEAAGGGDHMEAIATPEQVCAKAIKRHQGRIERAQRWLTHYENRLAYEKAMLDEQGATDLIAPKPRSKGATELPLLNYRAPGGIDCPNIYHRGEMIHYPQIEMTKAEYAEINRDYKGTRICERSHRVRTAMRNHGLYCVFLTDSKEHQKPAPGPAPEAPAPAPRVAPQPAPLIETRSLFSDLRDALAEGIKVVSAPQLFPTPPNLAARMVELAEIEPGHRVLEPSAGTGNILRAIGPTPDKVAVEINAGLVATLTKQGHSGLRIHQGDFLQCNGELGTFDRVLMNPPFKDAQDIEHITHALHMLRPGGRLVAICANGPRQQNKLRPIVEAHGGSWETLPAGTFAESGTNVSTALLVIDRQP